MVIWTIRNITSEIEHLVFAILRESDLTRFNKIAIQGTPQMAVDKEAISLSRVYSYDFRCTCRYSMCNPP